MKSLPENGTPILVVDDDAGLLASVRAMLLSAGLPEPALFSDSTKVVEVVKNHNFRVILLDLIMPNLSGMELLRVLKEKFPDVECVMVTAVDEVSSAVEAMKYGAYDYLIKPLQSDKLIITVNRALERYNLRYGLALFEKSHTFSDLEHPEAFKDIVTEDETMALVFHQAEMAAATDYNVVITGESGTGKELLARSIHCMSDRATAPFLPVNMAAFSRTLFEDELFGHTKGAYTGAVGEKKGFFEAAKGGVLFLDEITELPPELQAKLLRVIQERELYRLGSTEARNVDVRIIAASNTNIAEEVRQGHFRADLFYRLNVCRINIPPLRERRKDILLLARHFLEGCARENQKKIDTIDAELKENLLQYSFPGNVRELENMIASGVLMEKGRSLTLPSVPDLAHASGRSQNPARELLTLSDVEEHHILHVLDMMDGNRTRAARVLGIGLRTLQRKLNAFSKTADTPG